MKALFGSFIVDGRNKVNGHVVSKNRYGSYIRTKVTPVNPQTDAQQAARNNLATWSQNWRSLAESDRQSWIDAAPNFPFTDIFGNIKFLSGQALYVKLNTNIANVSGTAIDTAPAPVGLPAIDSIALTASSGPSVLSLAYSIPDANADSVLVVEATPNVAPGKSFVKNLFRYTTQVLSTTASPLVMTTAWTALFGDTVAFQKVFIRARIVNKETGQSGIPLQTVAIVS